MLPTEIICISFQRYIFFWEGVNLPKSASRGFWRLLQQFPPSRWGAVGTGPEPGRRPAESLDPTLWRHTREHWLTSGGGGSRATAEISGTFPLLHHLSWPYPLQYRCLMWPVSFVSRSSCKHLDQIKLQQILSLCCILRKSKTFNRFLPNVEPIPLEKEIKKHFG